jgi:hypothetical protein
VVEVPDRPLTYEEQLNLRTVLGSGNRNVKLVQKKGGDEE